MIALEQLGLPKHVAIIMDGNGRWATRQGLSRKAGHKAGADAFEKISQHANQLGILVLTVYAFSTENFSRPQEEVDAIMDLLRSYLKDRKRRKSKNVRTKFIGERKGLASDIIQMIEEMEEETAKNTGMVLNIALNYGGQTELLRGAQRLAKEYAQGNRDDLDQMSVDQFEQYLYTAGQPPVDLLIRTSGEQRISNFLLWQSAYAEFVFDDTLWPDYKPKDFDRALEEYRGRNRRIGGV